MIMSCENIRSNILDSVSEFRDKKSKDIIPIIKRELKFETGKYSSTKDNIWHVFINDIKLKKTSEYVISYKCLSCNQINSCSTTQFLRKIRQCKSQCFQCNVINLNIIKHIPKDKVEKKKVSLIEFHENSILEFNNYPDQYKNSFLLSHLSEVDYDRIKKNIISLGNGKYTDMNNYQFWSIYKVNNQMKFSSIIYNIAENTIFKAHQPIIKCDNCEKNWKCKSLELFKNCYKILCPDCKLCNRTFKIRPIKNINGDVLMYQSKLELKFVNWCENNNIVVNNGPNIDYVFNGKLHKYRVDFMINNILIEIKDFHIWHKNQVTSGLWDEKIKAVNKYIEDNNMGKYYFITPRNWNEKLTELTKIIK